MPIINGPFTIRKGEDITKNKKLFAVIEKEGIITPFNSDKNKTLFTRNNEVKLKSKKNAITL